MLPLFTSTQYDHLTVYNPASGQTEKFRFDPASPRTKEDARRKMEDRGREIVSSIRQRIGREPTAIELRQGFLSPATDSRTDFDKMRDSDWKPKLRDTQSNLENLLSETHAEIERQNTYKGMTPLEARAHDMERMLDREAEAKLAAEQKAKHLEKVEPNLQALDALITRENWSDSSDNGYRSLLRRTRQQLLEPNGDRTETLRLLKKVDAAEEARRVNQLAGLQQQAQALAEQQTAIAQQQASLSEGMEGGE